MSNTRECQNCSNQFPIRDYDIEFYKKMEVPWPTWCPKCRHLRRHAHINDYVFYSRACDGCNKQFVAIYPPKSDYTVYCQECFYSETRDDKVSALSWDPNRSFFSQFDELMHKSVQMGIIGRNNENCDFCESVANCKNCYLISECSNCEDCMYSYWIQKTIHSLDCCYTHECQHCYELSDCFNCYNLKYSTNCTLCSDAYFLDNCTSCKNCIACTNLRHKSFHIFNKQYSKDEYEKISLQLNLSSRSSLSDLSKKFDNFKKSQPTKALQSLNTENCFGDYVRNAKNCHYVFHSYEAEDCAYGEHVFRGAKHCMDANTSGRAAEWIYECTNCSIDTNNVKFSRYCWSSVDIEYCNQCFSCKNIFGCVSLKPNSQYCILNKQFSKDEYFAILPKIKEKMLKDAEYGEFFPISISLFGYNNTPSFDEGHYNKTEILKKGWKWEEQYQFTKDKGTLKSEDCPDYIEDTNDSIIKEILTCKTCSRNYRITNSEFSFYKKQNIPLPVVCYDCRHRDRLAKRNTKEFKNTKCNSCNQEIVSTVSSQYYEKIYCEKCYENYVR